MALLEREIKTLYADKEEMRRIVEEQYNLMGIEFDPTATAEMAQKMVGECLEVHGIRPEENIFSRGIVAARDAR